MKLSSSIFNFLMAALLASGVAGAGEETGGVTKEAGLVEKPSASKTPLPSFTGLRVTTTLPSTDKVIVEWEQRTRSLPNDSFAFADLASAYLQRARETNDPAHYARAEKVLKRTQELQPDNYAAMRLRAELHSARHQFPEAIRWVEKARAARPEDRMNYGLLFDIYTELGEYDKAKEAAQKMMDLRPDRPAYSRASYVQELYGNDKEAIRLMQMAIDAGSPLGEGAAWCHVYLGHLYFDTGALEAAEREYQAALMSFPGYYLAYAGLGKAKAARKEYPEALQMYHKAFQSGPHHETLAALIDLYSFTGQKEKAKEQRDALMTLQKRYAENGMDIDFEVAEIDAEGGKDLPGALKLAKEEVKKHGNIKAYDALAWIAFRSGDLKQANSAMKRALQLGTRNPLMLYHAAKIQERLGWKKESLSLFRQALAQAPYFHLRYAEDARLSAERLSKELLNDDRSRPVKPAGGAG